MITAEKEKELKSFAADIRISCMKQLGTLGVGHVGGVMSICDLMACLYGGVMKIDPKNPRWEQRDRFIMSKGHAGPAMYAALALKGYFDPEELETLNRPGTRLPSHTDRNRTPGVDMTTGSLGQGFSSGLGIALGCKMKKLDNYVYILVGDGECQEGQVWECAMFAPAKRLTNVIAFLDYNRLQIDGTVEEVSGVTDFGGKFREFGWQVLDVANGNEVSQIMEAIDAAQADREHPSMIILNTKKGKGCSFAEDVFNHNIPVTKEQAKQAIAELKAYKAAL
ncbi:MAG: transketolase [Lachnospiraceae bacterium]|nr:transketolase [Lachnospiraceae bacterium]